MNVVFISPNFPPNWFRFVVGLHAAGATTFGIADQHRETLRPELRAALDEFYMVDDLSSYDQLTRALGWFIHRRGLIDRIDSLNEHWLTTEARLRSDFNIPGLNQRTIGVVKHKSLMKRRFVSAGIRVAQGRVSSTPRALRRWVAHLGYPVVAKPDVGVGADRTYLITSDIELERFIAREPLAEFIVEEFIDGQIVTYDGLTDRDGQVVFESSFTYSIGVMESVNEQREVYYWTDRGVPADVRDVGRSMARIFDVRERPFHFEMFRTADGGLVGLEVNMRPPGGLSIDLMNYANDVDLYQEWANVVVHGRFEAVVTRPWACLYLGRRDGRRYLLSHSAAMREYRALVILEARMERMFAPAMGDHAYVLRGPDAAELVAAAQHMMAVH